MFFRRYCKDMQTSYFGYIGCLAHPKWYYQLVEDFDVYLHAKKFIIHFFLEILHFKESCNLISEQSKSNDWFLYDGKFGV